MRHLFLLASTRLGGNSEALARVAASALPPEVEQRWLRLSDHPLDAFADLRHDGSGVYPMPEGSARLLLEATLWCTDLVFVAPTYWYGLPAAAKLYLDHWSGWMRVPGVDFRARMGERRLWGITVNSDDPGPGEGSSTPLVGILERTADYLRMRWGGVLIGHGNRPGDVMTDEAALAAAHAFFAGAV